MLAPSFGPAPGAAGARVVGAEPLVELVVWVGFMALVGCKEALGGREGKGCAQAWQAGWAVGAMLRSAKVRGGSADCVSSCEQTPFDSPSPRHGAQDSLLPPERLIIRHGKKMMITPRQMRAHDDRERTNGAIGRYVAHFGTASWTEVA